MSNSQRTANCFLRDIRLTQVTATRASSWERATLLVSRAAGRSHAVRATVSDALPRGRRHRSHEPPYLSQADIPPVFCVAIDRRRRGSRTGFGFRREVTKYPQSEGFR